MGSSNNQNLVFGIIFLGASVFSFMRGETIALISSVGMSLIFFMIYITFRIMRRKFNT